ncbi:MAG: glycosyltransferase family 4 protein [Nitrospirae bacterium]|nr:glycosyltransferase family 4 protein [Nitrospirota bacterium]
MKIGINAAHLNETPTGIGVFTREVSEALLRQHKDIEIFTSLPPASFPDGQVSKVPEIIQGSTAFLQNLCRFLYLNLVLPGKGNKDKIDLLYCPMLEFPYAPMSRLVVTVHDLHPLLFPAQFGHSARYFKLSLRLLKKAASRVTVVSHFVKKELLNATDLEEDKIDVIPNGYDKTLFRPQALSAKQAFMERYSLKGNYILFVGNLFPYKNVRTLTEAFLRVKDRLDHELVIVGRKDLGGETLPLDDRILYMDYVPYHDLPGFYSYADLLVHPSLAEGFGFTPLEAMACGTPVLSSNRASLPEVVGEAGILFDPLDGASLGSLMVDVLGNKTLLRELGDKGTRQAEKFSWDRTASGLMKTFEKAMED